MKPFDTSQLLSRRHAIKLAGGCAAMTAGPLMSTITGLRLQNSALAAQDLPSSDGDYKGMVCVYLFGGNDAFNTLVPREPSEYADYKTARGAMALKDSDLLPITTPSGRRFGLHPSMPDLQQMFNGGNLAFVANAGALVRPTTKADYNRGTALPLGLFSHPDQARVWQTSIPQSRSDVTGWAGRMADILSDSVNDNPHISMNIAVNSVNLFQTGRDVVPYVVKAQRLEGYGKTQSAVDRIYTKATDRLLATRRNNVMERAFAEMKRGSIDSAIQYNDALKGVNLNTQFPGTTLGDQMKLVAETIAARGVLGQRRQTFFTLLGGWDFHDEVLVAQGGLLKEVNDAFTAFNNAMIELGVQDKVTTFTASDFGRTLSSNGNGTDHAWGGHAMVMGGPVNGGQVYGDYPTSLLDDSLNIGRGRLLPTTSVDEYNAELAMWFGVENDNKLETILPNIRNFYSSGSPTGPLGFLT